jgi:hypothetical protein
MFRISIADSSGHSSRLVNFAQLNECACRNPSEAAGGNPMPPLDELYEYHARDCINSAEQTDDPKHRELLLKMAREWTQEAAALRAAPEQP